MKIHKVILGIFILISIAGSSEAASFDCGKAKTSIEKIICRNNELSKLDEDMSKSYFETLKKLDSILKNEFISDHKLWLKKVRNACSNAECLKMAYTKRIENFRVTLLTEIAGGCTGFVVSVPEKDTVSEEIEDTEDEWEGEEGYLEMSCNYSDHGTYESEAVSIKRAVAENGTPNGATPGIKTFKRAKNSSDSIKFILIPGQFAECIFPSGNRVRAKVGRGSMRAYGECGADPEIFLSLWVNKRKIASAEWFAGHCIDYRNDVPDLSYDISDGAGDVTVKKCLTSRKPVSEISDENNPPKEESTEPIQVCIDYPDISKYPVDTMEYPPSGAKVSKAGDIEMVYDSGPVANAVRDELRKDFHAFSGTTEESSGEFIYPEWSEASQKLPGELSDCGESVFDFNNDGKLDRVFGKLFTNHYMDGSVLLVQPGLSSKKLMVSSSASDKTSIYLPYHLDGKRKKIDVYPPFSQENDEANFLMAVDVKGKKHVVEFRGRYTYVTPVVFRKTTYILLCGPYEDSQNHVAVLKPMPNGTFQNIGLIRKVQENF